MTDMPRTIRARITAAAVVIVAVMLSVVSVVLLTMFRAQLLDNLDESLQNRAETIGAVAGRALRQPAPPSELSVDEDLLIQIVAEDRRVLMSSQNLSGVAPISQLEPGLRTVHVPNRKESFRVVTQRLDSTPTSPWLLVGTNADDVTDALAILRPILALTVPAVLVALGIVTWWVTGRTLRPVENMRTELAQITASDPSRRIPEPGTGDEIDRLSRTMNDTLARLHSAVSRQQQFVADASHELRSPLARIRANLEVDLTHPAHAQPFETERNVLNDAIELEHIVEDLLQLARADANTHPLEMRSIDLDELVRREARRLTERGRVRVDTSHVLPAPITADPRLLTRAIRNVLDNAERHATSTVTITVDQQDGTTRLQIADDGPGIAPQHRELVFERFARLDDARTRHRGGTGLGLAIARGIVEQHGGTIRLADTTQTQFDITITEPTTTVG